MRRRFRNSKWRNCMEKKQKRVGFVKQRSKTMKETSVHLHKPPQTKGKQQEGVQQTQQIYLKGNSKEISEKMPKKSAKKAQK